MISVLGVKKVSSRGKGTRLRRAVSKIDSYLYDCRDEVSDGIKDLKIGSYELR